MTLNNDTTGNLMTIEREPTEEERDTWRRNHLFVPVDEIDAEMFPRLSNFSAGFLFHAVARPEQPEPPEYVAVPMLDDSLEMAAVVGQWNLQWESAQFRRRFFDEDDLPRALWRIAELGDVNITLVPRTRSRYFEYSPLIHLLSRATLERFGLPLLRAGTWPDKRLSRLRLKGCAVNRARPD